ncbi:hypothetical protein IAR55_000187 [Kwoniella newhampshirensis]|uniref:Endothelin-converting enzyme n=1 Tax=Kwoniella newhampshirensis TaxID=1651941 RepID=A0AAW0Z614_9TREE
MAQPRASTDQENAPLLDNGNDGPSASSSSSPFKKMFSPSRPLSFFEKVLGALAVLLLLLMSIFVGLFAGAEGMLKKERQKTGKVEWKTEYRTHTRTATATKTSLATTTVSAVPTGKPEPKVCLTPECVTLSASIIQSLNTSVDPCDDFYEFATGGWAATHSIPADKGIYGAFNEVADNNKKIILRVLDAIPSGKPKKDASADELNLAKLKAVYTSCIDTDTLNEIGRKPLIALTDHVVELFGPFDLNPAPSSDLIEETQEWQGTYDETYRVSDHLLASGERATSLQKTKKSGHGPSDASDLETPTVDLAELDESSVGEDRQKKITKTLAWLHSRGVDALVNFAIEGDAGGEDSQVQSLWLYQASGGLPSKEYYEEAPILDLYQSVVSGILTDVAQHTSIRREKTKRGITHDIENLEGLDELEALIESIDDLVEEAAWPWPWPSDGDKDGEDSPGKDHDDTKDEPVEKRMEKLAGKVVKFERDLIRAGADPEYLFNPHYSYNPYPTEKVSKALPFLSIPAYLSSYAIRVFPANITVTYPPYLKSITRLIEETPDYVLSGYFVTRLALSYAGPLGPKTTIRQEHRRLQEVLRGIKRGTEENREDLCLSYVDDTVGYIAGREFVREAFSPEAKKEGEHIIRSIVKAFSDKLPHISWMDEESAKAAQKKAESLIPKVGYPLFPNTTHAESVQSWYSRLDVKTDDFFGTVFNSILLEESRTWMSLGRRRNRESWEMYPQTVNAYYSPPDGEIVFPAGILQPPFYSQAWPAHLRYGAFGAVAAHELTHAFDNTGSQYDDKGRLRDWWTQKTVKNFEERAQCLSKQYSKYYVLDEQGKKVYVNGNLTNGEDIGDSGLAQAFLAWKNSADTSDPERLPGLDFSEEQLFFLGFARVWAQLTRPATAVSRVRTDPHSPPYWRATGTLRNLDAFHKAFNCKSGSTMNPAKKDQCELW